MNSSVPVGSLGPLTVVWAGCELERSERSSSERSAHGDTCCSGRDGMRDRRRGAEQLGGERVEQTLPASDLGESPQRTATRIADGVRRFAPAPLQADMATVVVQVTPAAASEVAA